MLASASHPHSVPSCASPANMAAQLDRVSRAEGGEDGIRIGAVAVENEKTEDSGLQAMHRRLAAAEERGQRTEDQMALLE